MPPVLPPTPRRSPRKANTPSEKKRMSTALASLKSTGDQTIESGTFEFGNGFFQFVGTTVNGRPHGDGTLYRTDGGSISGEFDNGEVHGEGVQRWANGSVYYGEFRRGEPHGYGRQVMVDGTEYEGEFAFGRRSGQGRFLDRVKGIEYIGEFRGSFDGHGSLRPLRRLPSTYDPAAVEAEEAKIELERRRSEELELARSASPEPELPEPLTGIPRGPSGRHASVTHLIELPNRRVSTPTLRTVSTPSGGGRLEPMTSGSLGKSTTLPEYFGPQLTSQAGSIVDELPASPAKRATTLTAPDAPMPIIPHQPDVVGQFKQGIVCGEAQIRYVNGDSYSGECDAAPHGNGKFISAATGITYNGPMRRGRRREYPTDLVLQDLLAAPAHAMDTPESILNSLTVNDKENYGLAMQYCGLDVHVALQRHWTKEEVVKDDPSPKRALSPKDRARLKRLASSKSAKDLKSRASSTKGGKHSKKNIQPELRLIMTEVKEEHPFESGRKVFLEAFEVPAGLNAADAKRAVEEALEVFDDSDFSGEDEEEEEESEGSGSDSAFDLDDGEETEEGNETSRSRTGSLALGTETPVTSAIATTRPGSTASLTLRSENSTKKRFAVSAQNGVRRVPFIAPDLTPRSIQQRLRRQDESDHLESTTRSRQSIDSASASRTPGGARTPSHMAGSMRPPLPGKRSTRASISAPPPQPAKQQKPIMLLPHQAKIEGEIQDGAMRFDNIRILTSEGGDFVLRARADTRLRTPMTPGLETETYPVHHLEVLIPIRVIKPSL